MAPTNVGDPCFYEPAGVTYTSGYSDPTTSYGVEVYGTTPLLVSYSDDFMDWGNSRATSTGHTKYKCTTWYKNYKEGLTNTLAYGSDRTGHKLYISCQERWEDIQTTGGWIQIHGNVDEVLARLQTPQERLRGIIQTRQGPAIHISRKAIAPAKDVREIRARETLHRVLGEEKFQRFLKDGFVSVRAKSGLIYQIFPGHGITTVYRDGEPTERLCVVLKGDFPPTDSLIMRYLIILNDENRFRGYAVKHQLLTRAAAPKPADQRSLVEIFQQLKKRVA